MTSKLLIALFLLQQALLLTLSEELHSIEELQRAVDSKCALRKLYKEHKARHELDRSEHPTHEKVRLSLFLKHVKKAVELRADPDIEWDVGLNFMGDYTDEELANIKGYSNTSLESTPNLKRRSEEETRLSAFSPPDEFDEWRKKKMIGSIHWQKKGSCWAHAATVPLEAQLAYYTGKFLELSVQELYDCVYEGTKPDGGLSREAFDYVKRVGRLGTAKESPETFRPFEWMEGKTSCKGYDKKTNALQGYTITSTSPVFAAKILDEKLNCVGPVTVSMDTEHGHLNWYTGGLYTLKQKYCQQTDHALTIVGYDKQAYFVRNSWSSLWGKKGYLLWNRQGPFCDYLSSAYSVKLQDLTKEKYGELPCRFPTA